MDFHYDIDASNAIVIIRRSSTISVARCPHDATKQLDKGYGWQALGNIEGQKLHVLATALQKFGETDL